MIQGALSGQKGNTGFDLWMFSSRQLPFQMRSERAEVLPRSNQHLSLPSVLSCRARRPCDAIPESPIKSSCDSEPLFSAMSLRLKRIFAQHSFRPAFFPSHPTCARST